MASTVSQPGARVCFHGRLATVVPSRKDLGMAVAIHLDDGDDDEAFPCELTPLLPREILRPLKDAVAKIFPQKVPLHPQELVR